MIRRYKFEATTEGEVQRPSEALRVAKQALEIHSSFQPVVTYFLLASSFLVPKRPTQATIHAN